MNVIFLEYKKCPRGGGLGLLITETQFRLLTDELIPFEERIPVRSCTNNHKKPGDYMRYFEVKGSGSHGYFCESCGTIVQWG